MADLSSDIGGIADIDATMSTVSGRLKLAQAILRRLRCPRGGMLGVPSYGFDLTSVIGSQMLTSFIEQRVTEQVLLEEEVSDTSVAVTFDDRTSVLLVEISVVASEGPFELTITASELTFEAFVNGSPFFSEGAAA